MDNNTLEL